MPRTTNAKTVDPAPEPPSESKTAGQSDSEDDLLLFTEEDEAKLHHVAIPEDNFAKRVLAKVARAPPKTPTASNAAKGPAGSAERKTPGQSSKQSMVYDPFNGLDQFLASLPSPEPRRVSDSHFLDELVEVESAIESAAARPLSPVARLMLGRGGDSPDAVKPSPELKAAPAAKVRPLRELRELSDALCLLRNRWNATANNCGWNLSRQRKLTLKLCCAVSPSTWSPLSGRGSQSTAPDAAMRVLM